MSDTQHIFLSYRSIEADFALKLAANLKNAGVKLWMDKLDGIRGGDDWRRQIESALHPDSCALMIAILSPEYLQADYCRNELARADSLKIPILPILLYPFPRSDTPIEITRLQYTLFCQLDKNDRLERTWRETDLYDSALQTLLTALPNAQKGAVPDAETQYLNTLIAELESRKGVLEYVELSAQTDAPRDVEAVRPPPRPVNDEWAAGFSMLVERPVGALREAPSDTPSPEKMLGKEDKIHLNSITEAVEKHPRFVLIGEPGAGKTTTIRHLALEAARKRLENPRTAPLPLLLYLPQWDDESTPLDFVRKHWPFSSDPSGLLAQGDVLLYLDGLNEMGASGIEKAAKLREWLGSDNAPEQVIITCRTGDYTGNLKFGDVPTVQAEEMNEKKIREFAKKYLGKKVQAFLKRILSQKNQAYEPSRSLFRLTKNPYLLAALIFVYQQSPNGELPRNNGALMRTLVQALWEREHQKKTPGWIPFEQMEKKLARLSFEMINKNKAINIPINFALRYVGNEGLLRAGHSANIIEMGEQGIRYYHQLIQEYFASINLRDKDLVEIMIPPEFGIEHRKPTKWDQVVIARSGIVLDPDTFIRDIASYWDRSDSFFSGDPWLAAECILSGVNVNHSTREEIINRLVDVLLVEDIDEYGEDEDARWVSAKLLGEFNDVSAVVGLINALIHEKDKSIIHLIEQSISSRSTITIPELVKALDVAPQPIIRIFEKIGLLYLPKLLDALCDLSDEAFHDIKYYVKTIVVGMGNRAIPDLINCLFKQNRRNKLLAIQLLGHFEDKRAVQSLVKLFENENRLGNFEDCEIIAESLLKNGTRDSYELIINWWKKRLHNARSFKEQKHAADAISTVERWREEQGKKSE